MATKNIRLGSMLSFDEDQEKDIIDIMEYLNATHSTGKFISNLIRIALDNPEILDTSNGKFEKGAIIKQLETLGVSYNRNIFFNNLSKEVEFMKKKVDKIYDMAMKTYMLAQMGKHIGLETKSDNTLMAGFILEKQLKDIQDSLGVTLGASPFESSKLDVAHKRAEDALEYIIETYDSLINELRMKFEVQGIEIPVKQIETGQSIEVDQINRVDNNTNTINSISTMNQEQSSDDDNEEIDFGNADMSMLSNFFNM